MGGSRRGSRTTFLIFCLVLTTKDCDLSFSRCTGHQEGVRLSLLIKLFATGLSLCVLSIIARSNERYRSFNLACCQVPAGG